MGYDITVYRDMSCVITPDHHKTPSKHNFYENRPPCCGLRFALAPCLCPLLALSSAWPFLSSFCYPSDEHITGLTKTPTFSTRDSACYMSAWLFLFRFSFFTFPVSFLVIYIPEMFSILISVLTENVKKSHDIPRNLDTIPNTSFWTTSVSYLRVVAKKKVPSRRVSA